MKALKHFIVFIFLLCGIALKGQDIHFSQFSQSPLLLNPANAGLFPADLRISALHRRQWAAVTVPYKTFSLAADAKLSAVNEKLKGLNAGILLHHDQAGDGQLTTLDARLFLGYRMALSADSIHFIRAGVMGGFSQRSIHYDKLTFDAQFDGDVFNPAYANGELFNGNRVSWADFGMGLGWDLITENSSWQAGLSATHINQPDHGFFNETVQRPVLWIFQASGALKVSEHLHLLPAILYLHQLEFREINTGAELKIRLTEENQKQNAIGFGLFHRFHDALIPSLALYLGKFRFGLSYDINTSGLKTVSHSRGGPEFSVVYMARKIKVQTQRNIICPVY